MTNSGLIQIHPELEESAQMSGATAWQGFRRIVVPLLAPTLLYAWLWIALLVFRELPLAVILSTADNVTFPVVVWNGFSSSTLGSSGSTRATCACRRSWIGRSRASSCSRWA